MGHERRQWRNQRVTKHAASTQGNSIRLVVEDDGTFLGEYVHGGKISEDSFYRVWVLDQEYAEGELMSGLPARDDGYARKGGFRFDKELGMDLDLTIAGGFATRRVDHVLDLTYEAFDGGTMLPLNATGLNLVATHHADLGTISCCWRSVANQHGDHSGFGLQIRSISELREDAAGRLPSTCQTFCGITDGDLEWSMAGYAELYDTTLGHIGHSWEREEFDIDFKANKPIGDSHHVAFGLSYRHLTLDVVEAVTVPWDFQFMNHKLIFLTGFGSGNPPSFTPPILEYGNSETSFDRFTGFLQDSISFSDQLVLSVGAKFEESDLTGSSFQLSTRLSYSLDNQNIIWGAYSHAHRQPSLVEKFTDVSLWSSIFCTWRSFSAGFSSKYCS